MIESYFRKYWRTVLFFRRCFVGLAHISNPV